MPAQALRWFSLRLSVAAVALAACRPDGESAAQAQQKSTFHIDSLHPMLQPVTRQHRPYKDAKTGEPEMTAVIAIRIDRADRFILAQEPGGGGPLIVVSDSAGRIPAFNSAGAAIAYRDSVFPIVADTADPEFAALRGQMQKLVDDAGALRVDFDAALAWARAPQSDHIGPAQAELVWDVLAGAAAAPMRLQFDPMGMYGLTENQKSGSIDSTSYRIAMTGMIVGGLMSEIRRKGGDHDIPWCGTTAIAGRSPRSSRAASRTSGRGWTSASALALGNVWMAQARRVPHIGAPPFPRHPCRRPPA
jgi:hypothetical protein